MLATDLKHTSGPWQIGGAVQSDNETLYYPIRARDKMLSTTSVYGKRHGGKPAGEEYVDRHGTRRHRAVISEEECLANAKLIAASPDLLDVALRMQQLGAELRALVEAGGAYGIEDTTIFAALDAAIERATT